MSAWSRKRIQTNLSTGLFGQKRASPEVDDELEFLGFLAAGFADPGVDFFSSPLTDSRARFLLRFGFEALLLLGVPNSFVFTSSLLKETRSVILVESVMCNCCFSYERSASFITAYQPVVSTLVQVQVLTLNPLNRTTRTRTILLAFSPQKRHHRLPLGLFSSCHCFCRNRKTQRITNLKIR